MTVIHPSTGVLSPGNKFSGELSQINYPRGNHFTIKRITFKNIDFKNIGRTSRGNR